MRSGYGRSLFKPLLPLIIGRDISGEVAATGTSSSSFSVGQEVFGALHPTALRGTYADYAILSLDELTLKPSTLSHVVGVIKLIPLSLLVAFFGNTMLGSISVCYYGSFCRPSKVLLPSLNLGDPVFSCAHTF